MNIFSSWLAARFPEVSPFEFYREIFPVGELEKKGEYTNKIEGAVRKYTGIIIAVTDQKKYTGKVKVKRYTLTDELQALDEATGSNDFCICSPLSYAGGNRTSVNARYLYAIAVDLDRIRTNGLEPDGLRVLWHQVNTDNDYTGRKLLPHPTFIVSSGTGLHLYFVLQEPVPLYREFAMELQELKRELTRLIWNDYIVNIDSPHDIQQEGIYQGFRMPGTVTKKGDDRVRAFQTGGKVSLDYLNGFMPPESKARSAAAANRRGKLTLVEAKKKYPEWYDRRIEKKEKRGTWHTSRRLYDWWKNKILSGATVGHRYYCVMMLAIYAQKCSYYDAKHNPQPVTLDELQKDAYSLIEPFEKLTDSEDNHFGIADVQDALEAFQDCWTTYPRSAIEYRTAISMPPSKRNKQRQEDHLEEARAIRDIRSQRRGEKWDAHNGRKSKAEDVILWRAAHPTGTVAACVKETGISQATVYRHWNGSNPEKQAATAEKKLQAEEVRRLEELSQEAKRLSQTIREQMKAGEAVTQELKRRLDYMPEGAEKEKARKAYLKALEELHTIKALVLPE